MTIDEYNKKMEYLRVAIAQKKQELLQLYHEENMLSHRISVVYDDNGVKCTLDGVEVC